MTELLIEHPPGYESERTYIYDVMFGEFLGISYRMKVGAEPKRVVITARGDPSEKRLIVDDTLFGTQSYEWLTPHSLPRQPLEMWTLPDTFHDTPKVSSEIPIIYGQRVTDKSYYAESGNTIHLGLDVFGSSFFMLTRYEEVVKKDRDEHDRFPATASLAYQEGFLNRPIVNEYLEILWSCMKKLWPGLRRKERHYRVLLSHDVDHPFSVIGSSIATVARNTLGDLIRRRDLRLALRRVLAYASSGAKQEILDPNATFDFIMDISERFGFRSAFYFMAANQRSRFDDGYPIEGGHIRRLLQSIANRDHEIGFHPSYNTFRDPVLMKTEFTKLCKAMAAENIATKPTGGRQHYLRWEAPLTWRVWDDLGLAYDSTVGFPCDPGFRAGTCYEYPVFDLLARKKLKLVERPLLFMDGSMWTETCTQLDGQKLVECIARYALICRKYNGDLCMLWHNSSLRSARQKKLYGHIVAVAAGM